MTAAGKNSNTKSSRSQSTQTVRNTTAGSATDAKIQAAKRFEESLRDPLVPKLSWKFTVSILIAYMIAIGMLMLLLAFLS